MYALVRPLLFALSASDAHAFAMHGLRAVEALARLHGGLGSVATLPESLRTTRFGLSFRSPIGLAGGFDKNAHAPHALAALGFGFLELGTVTALPQEANPSPNLFRLPDDRALVNRLGFPNDGAAAVAQRYLACGSPGVPVAFSIGKSRAVPVDDTARVAEDYLTSFRAVRSVADFVIVNVSSPNTKGLRALQGPALAHALLEALARENASGGSPLPLLLKVSPDLDDADFDRLLDVVGDIGLNGVVATNTTIARDGLRSRSDVVLAAGPGGLSGPPVKARALAMVKRARARLGHDATIIGVGGIETGTDALAYLDSGADLVQLYTGFVYGGPFTPARIARELAALWRSGSATVGEDTAQ